MSLPGRPAVGPPLCLCWRGRCLAGTERSRLSFLNLGRPFTGCSARKSGFGFVSFFLFAALGILGISEAKGKPRRWPSSGAAVLKWSASSLPVESVSVAYHTRGLLVLSGVTGRRRPPPSSQKTPADWGTRRSTALSPFSHSRGASLVAASRGGQQGLRCPLGTGLRQTRGGGGTRASVVRGHLVPRCGHPWAHV